MGAVPRRLWRLWRPAAWLPPPPCPPGAVDWQPGGRGPAELSAAAGAGDTTRIQERIEHDAQQLCCMLPQLPAAVSTPPTTPARKHRQQQQDKGSGLALTHPIVTVAQSEEQTAAICREEQHPREQQWPWEWHAALNAPVGWELLRSHPPQRSAAKLRFHHHLDPHQHQHQHQQHRQLSSATLLCCFNLIRDSHHWPSAAFNHHWPSTALNRHHYLNHHPEQRWRRVFHCGLAGSPRLAAEGTGGSGSSWMGRVKEKLGWGAKETEEAEEEPPPEITLEMFVKVLKMARHASLLSGVLPVSVPEGAGPRLAALAEAAEKVVAEMTEEERQDPVGKCTRARRTDISLATGVPLFELNSILDKYSRLKVLAPMLYTRLKKGGKKELGNVEEVMTELLGQRKSLPAAIISTAPGSSDPSSEPPSRNATCPCGSGKRYKRCCGWKPRPPLLPEVDRHLSV